MLARKDKSKPKDIVGLLGKGTSFNGKLTFEGTVRIDGSFSGEVVTNGLLVIGDEAVVHAGINAETIIIRGEMHGNVKATRTVEIRGNGKLYGDIQTPSLIVEESVRFEGSCTMSRNEEEVDKAEPDDVPDSEKQATA